MNSFLCQNKKNGSHVKFLTHYNTDALKSWENAVAWLRLQPDHRRLVVDCYYDDPLKTAAHRYWQSDEWESIQRHLVSRSGKALDVGAGRGIASYAMARNGFAVTALEPDPSRLVGAEAIRALADETGLPIHVVEDFSERLPFVDDEFDLVFARAVLHHMRDLEKVCREFFRVLKPGGLLIVIREHVISKEEDLSRFFDIHPLHKLYGGENAYRLDQYLNAFKKAGFLQLEVLSPWHSPVNFAPHTLKSLKAKLAMQIAFGRQSIKRFVVFLLDFPGIWPLVRFLLEQFDNRPGRLYSFIAEKS